MNLFKKIQTIAALSTASITFATSSASAAPCVTNSDCDDGAFCNGVETCDAADPTADADGCVAGVDPSDDGASCTTDMCDEINDTVTNTPDDAPCQNGLFCDGAETCAPSDAGADAATGCVQGTRPSSDDSIDCTFDSCDEGADEEDDLGMFRNVPDNGACDDGDACTANVCTAGVGCASETIGCTIGDACYLDGASNPTNLCQVCDIAGSTTAWASANAGDECAAPVCSGNGASLVAASTCDDAGTCESGAVSTCANGCGEDACRDTCAQDSDCPTGWCNVDVDQQCTTLNRAPVARAGDDQQADSEVTVTLNGGGSFDPDADLIASYRWTQSRGPAVQLDDASSRNPTFTAPRVRDGEEMPEVVFALIVNDGELDSEPDFTKVTVNPGANRAPVAAISGPSGVDAGVELTLDGSDSSDADGDPIASYQWSQTGGPDATLGETNQATLTLTLPDAVGESVTFQLIVSDGVANSEATTLTIELLEPLEQPTDGGEDASGGGCASAPEGPPASGLGGLALLALGALVGRRRRRS